MSKRKNILINNEIYHIFDKSIERYIIFNTFQDFFRIIDVLNYYQYLDIPFKFSLFNKLDQIEKDQIINKLKKGNIKLIEIIAYCIMPTHYHLILKQLVNDGISNYMAKVSNSYSTYFNLKHHRKGPLWQEKFKNVLIENDEQLLHLTRYIHLNPVTSNLVTNPNDWKFSSYSEYLNNFENICRFNNLIDLNKINYEEFVDNQKNYQRNLHLIRKQMID